MLRFSPARGAASFVLSSLVRGPTGATGPAGPAISDASLLTSGTLAAARLPAFTGDVTGPGGSAVLTLATAQPAVHTWALAQTFTVAPVFTDAPGTRTALGLGSLAALTPGTGVATALAVNVGTAGAFVVNGGALGTPSSGTLTSATGLPISTGLTGAGTGVLTALGVNVGSAGAFVTFNGAGGTPSSIVLTNATGTVSGLTAVTASGLLQAGTTLGISTDVLLNRDAANTLAQRNGANAQVFNIYRSYTDASNYEVAQIGYGPTGSTSTFAIGTNKAGTGIARPVGVGTNLAGNPDATLYFQGTSIDFYVTSFANAWRMSTAGHFITPTDNTYDIGASGATRPRSIYVGSNLAVAGVSGFGGAPSSSTFANHAAGTTAISPMRLVQGVAPTAPVDGDIWREDNTNTGLKIRINGVTKTFTVT